MEKAFEVFLKSMTVLSKIFPAWMCKNIKEAWAGLHASFQIWNPTNTKQE
jgi:hypothetical protein